MRTIDAALVLVDISGYTRFVNFHSVSQVHAEEIITQLLEAVIDAAEFPLVLNKLEGDAVLLYTDAGAGPRDRMAKDVLKQVDGLFSAFRAKQNELIEGGRNGCPCDACENVDTLKLKAILHFGNVVVKQIRQFTELAGNEVILIHRLLKNSVGMPENMLITDAFLKLSSVPEGWAGKPVTEKYDDLAEVTGQAFPVQYGAPVAERKATLMPREMVGKVDRKLWWARLSKRLFRRRKFRNLPG